MFPLIREGDICRFQYCDSSQLSKGDIVLFHSSSGILVAHRLKQIQIVNNLTFYIFKGDSNLGMDKPISQERILGKLVWIQKGRSMLHMTSVTAYVWNKMILSLPILSQLLRMYLNRRESPQA